MRALVDMEDRQVEALDSLANRNRTSRAALIRAAIDEYLDRQHHEQIQDGFGLWGNDTIDGRAYQEKVRAEW